MYVGYLNDTMFKRTATVGLAGQTYAQCAVDRQMLNYFNVEMVVNDPRAERLMLGGKVVSGKLSFYYDGNRHKDEDPTKDDLFRHLGNEQLYQFFNVVEMVVFADGDSAAAINSNLNASSLTRGIYINNSVKLSKQVVSGKIYNLGTDGSETKITLPIWVQFSIQYPERDLETVKIYLDRDAFLDEYPYTTINRVILPCDPAYILEPSKIDGVVPAVIQSTDFSFGEINPEMVVNDHSGLLTYSTKYLTKSKQGTTVAAMLPFGVMYQGAKPSTLQIREAVREKLLATELASPGVWEAILPDLFVTAQFFIIPIWDTVTVRPQGIIYPSVNNLHKLASLLPVLFPNMATEYLEDYTEILVCGQSELFLIAIPDPLNKDEFSIYKKHPTYQLHMAQDGAAYINQDPNTRDFNARLNRCMAVASGQELLADVITQEMDDLTWHSFTSCKTEYHVLSQIGYNATFNKIK